MDYSILLVIVPVALLVFFIGWVSRKSNRATPKYDERQVAARGEAFKAGFFTFVICNALIAIMEGLELQWAESTAIEVLLTVFIAIGVFAVTAIRKDAYFGFNENIRSSVILLSIIAGMNLITGIMRIVDGEDALLENGRIGSGILNFAVTAVFICILAALVLHRKAQAAASDGESDE